MSQQVTSDTPIGEIKYPDGYIRSVAEMAQFSFDCCTIGDVICLTDQQLKSMRAIGNHKIRNFRKWQLENVIDVEIRFDKETPSRWRWLA
jgi:hypothetical protein